MSDFDNLDHFEHAFSDTLLVAVCNATPLIHLARIGRIELLRLVHGALRVPPADRCWGSWAAGCQHPERGAW
ncbi:MAG: hypothetical protein HY744_26985 [Deltaproteobacteria bacterium]|nr:hypothetical protein [Deltaproteobacteria bacterium]